MGQLRVQQADGVAPRAESARPILYASFPRYLGDFVLWNKIANLAQKVKPTTCWFDCFFLFHPCRVAGSKRQANTFFHFLWDGCDSFPLRHLHRMHLIFSGNLPDRFDAHQRFQSNFGFEGTRVPLPLSSFAHGSAVLSSPAEPEKSNLGYCPKFGVHFSVSEWNPGADNQVA